MTTPALGRVLAILRRCYGKPPNPPTRDPFQMILWEQIGYLVADAQRRLAFDALRAEVGLSPRRSLRRRMARCIGSLG